MSIRPLLALLLCVAVASAVAQPASPPVDADPAAGHALPARAALGIGLADPGTIGATLKVDGPVVASLVPGGAAAAAGLAVGDVLLSINGEPLAADGAAAANRRLVRFMESVNPGEELTLQYRRGGARPATARLVALAAPMPPRASGHAMSGHCPMHPGGARYRGDRHGPAAGGLRLADLTPGLGRYFGTDAGVLVLRAAPGNAFGLEDGDVIRRIGGRTPADRRHARRILASYAPGEAVVIDILRDRRARELKATLPRPGAGAK
jgi:S1-C subfamily serine protease